ncbi:unnamed protein product, partial [marine sediment metagenome]
QKEIFAKNQQLILEAILNSLEWKAKTQLEIF